MPDLSTLTQQVQEEMVRPAPVDQDLIWRALIDGMGDYRDKNFLFNEKSATWTSQVDKNSYGDENAEGAGLGHPNDFVSPVTLYYIKDDAIYDPIDMTTITEIRRMQDSITAQGLPNFWAYFAKQFHVDRRAHQEFDFKLDYLAQDAVPRYSYDGIDWLFEVDEDFDGTYLTLDGTFNPFMFQGKIGELIKWSAQARVARWLKDDAEYQRARGFEMTALRILERQVSARTQLMTTPPHD